MSRATIGNIYAAHPGADWLLALAASIAAFFFIPAGFVRLVAAEGVDLSVGASALFGVLFAAATFACTMAYTSTSTTMLIIRAFRAREQARTWLSILAALLVSAIASLLLIPVWGHLDGAAVAVTIGCLVLGTLVSLRVFWWFRMTLNGDAADHEARASGTTKLPSKVGPARQR